MVGFIKNLERFCNEVASNKLLWTPEVVAFFGVTDETLKRDFEFAREETQRQLQYQKEGSIMGRSVDRRQSYVNLSDAMANDEI